MNKVELLQEINRPGPHYVDDKKFRGHEAILASLEKEGLIEKCCSVLLVRKGEEQWWLTNSGKDFINPNFSTKYDVLRKPKRKPSCILEAIVESAGRKAQKDWEREERQKEINRAVCAEVGHRLRPSFDHGIDMMVCDRCDYGRLIGPDD